MSASPSARAVSGDRSRLFLTALLVYAVCLNPLLANPMTWSSLDATVSLVETGRWQVVHGALYGDMDVARAGERAVLGPPPGLAVTLVPLYLAWRSVAGPIATREAFQALHVVATLAIAAVASALAAGEVAALAGWLGASRRGRLWAAVLFAFGTPAFLFATRLFKENVAALVLIVAFRLAVTPGACGRRVAAGLLATWEPAIHSARHFSLALCDLPLPDHPRTSRCGLSQPRGFRTSSDFAVSSRPTTPKR